MKRFVAKAAIVVASVAALAAFAVPAMASAAVWGPAGATTSLESNLTFTAPEIIGTSSWTCEKDTYGAKVKSPPSSSLELTGSSGVPCFGGGPLVGCGIKSKLGSGSTVVGTKVGELMTVNFSNLVFEFAKGCFFGNGTMNFTGSIPLVSWNALTHTLTLNNTSIFEVKFPEEGGKVIKTRLTVKGTLKNTAGILTFS
jgi:hypothetical protein